MITKSHYEKNDCIHTCVHSSASVFRNHGIRVWAIVCVYPLILLWLFASIHYCASMQHHLFTKLFKKECMLHIAFTTMQGGSTYENRCSSNSMDGEFHGKQAVADDILNGSNKKMTYVLDLSRYTLSILDSRFFALGYVALEFKVIVVLGIF